MRQARVLARRQAARGRGPPERETHRCLHPETVREIDVGAYPSDPELETFVEARFADDSRTLVVIQQSNGLEPGPAYARRYDSRTGEPLGPAVRIGYFAGAVPTVPSQRDRLVFIQPDAILVVDAATLQVRRRIPVGGFVGGLSPDGRSVALGAPNGGVSILDLRSGELRALKGRHEDRVHGLVFTPDGRTLMTRSDDGKILVWDVESGRVRETLAGHTGPVPTFTLAEDGRTLYTGGLDDRIIVWDIAGDRRLARPFAKPFQEAGRLLDYPPPLAVSPSGETVAAGLPDGGIRLHDARTLRRLPDLPGLEDEPVWALEFSPDGETIAVTGESGTSGAARRGERPAGAAAAARLRRARSGDGVLTGRRPPRRCGSRRQPAGAGSGNRRCRADASCPASRSACPSAPTARLLAIGLRDADSRAARR